LEGNIGAGKSTLLRLLEACDGLRVETEPVDEWCRPVLPDGRGMLQAFYDDREANGFAFQLYVLLTRLRQARRVGKESRPVLMERCLESDYELFGRSMRESGAFGDPQWETYTAWHEEACTDVPRVSVIIYLRATPATCMKRIAARAREGEAAIDEAYLVRLHDAHEAWMARLQQEGIVKVIVLDANQDGEEAIVKLAALIMDALGVVRKDA
jgi:deoxyadenosine/deoxycytidine kinase